MKRLILVLILFCQQAYADTRIKDIVNFEGIRENVLIGYGLVVGLNGTGDNLKNSAFTEKGLTDFLEKLGVNTRGANLKTKNVAAVMVTATLPPFARSGSKISVDISTIGDAKSLKGGTLLATPLVGADGEVYAVSQGPISIGTKPSDEAGKPETNNPTGGFITSGAIVEREVAFDLGSLKAINLALKNPDISTARSIETAINSSLRDTYAFAKDPGTVNLEIPPQYYNNIVELLAEVENINVYPDTVAKIIIDESSGTIVFGENVKVSKVAIAQGNLIVKVGEQEEFEYNIGLIKDKPKASERGKEIAVLSETTKLSDLVSGLNSLGVKPKDLVSIIKSIKQAGALHAEIVVK